MKAENGLKKCSKCGEVKGVYEYSADKTMADNLCKMCKKCSSMYQKKYYEDNSDIIKKSTSEYSKIHILEMRKYRKKWRDGNKDNIRKSSAILASNLADGYIKGQIIAQTGIDKALITPELIEIKRTIIKTKRLCKTLKNSEAN